MPDTFRTILVKVAADYTCGSHFFFKLYDTVTTIVYQNHYFPENNAYCEMTSLNIELCYSLLKPVIFYATGHSYRYKIFHK